MEEENEIIEGEDLIEEVEITSPEMEEELSNGRGDDEDEQQSACKLYQAVTKLQQTEKPQD